MLLKFHKFKKNIFKSNYQIPFIVFNNNQIYFDKKLKNTNSFKPFELKDIKSRENTIENLKSKKICKLYQILLLFIIFIFIIIMYCYSLS